jgi:hypothetical protein
MKGTGEVHGLNDATGRKVIFYVKVVKDDELLIRNVYYFVSISITNELPVTAPRLSLQPE